MAGNPAYKNSNNPTPEDQNHNPVLSVLDSSTGDIVSLVGANIRTVTKNGKVIKIADLTSSAVSGGAAGNTIAAGNITAAQPTVGTPVAGGTVSINVADGQATVEAQLTGTFSAGTTLLFEGTEDTGATTNWFTTFGHDTGVSNPPNISQIAGGASKLINIPSAGYAQIRVRANPFQGGDNVAVRMIASTAGTSASSLSTNDGTFAKENGGHVATIDTSTAASKTDLDTIVTNTNKIPASPAQEGGNLASILTQVTNHTETNSAAIKTDLDTVVTNTNKIPASPATEGGHLATIDTSTAASKTDLDTIVTNTNKIPASPATEGGNLASIKTDLDTILTQTSKVPVYPSWTQVYSTTQTGVNTWAGSGDITVSQYQWLSIGFNVSALTGTSIQFKITRKDAFGNYVSLGSVTISSAIPNVLSVGPGMVVNAPMGNTVQVIAVFTAVTSSTFTVDVQAR